MNIRCRVEDYLADRATGRSGTSTATTMRMLALGCLIQGRGAEAGQNAELARLRNVAMGVALRRTFCCIRCSEAVAEREKKRAKLLARIQAPHTTFRKRRLIRQYEIEFVDDLQKNNGEWLGDDECECRRTRLIYERFVEAGRKRRTRKNTELEATDPGKPEIYPITIVMDGLGIKRRAAFDHLSAWEANLEANYKVVLIGVREMHATVRGTVRGTG